MPTLLSIGPRIFAKSINRSHNEKPRHRSEIQIISTEVTLMIWQCRQIIQNFRILGGFLPLLLILSDRPAFASAESTNSLPDGYWGKEFYSPGDSRSKVLTVAVGPDGSIYCGGDFSSFAQRIGAARIARFDGTTWEAMGGGLSPGKVYAILPVDQDVYVGGSFSRAGTNTAYNIARWDGTEWHEIGGGVSGEVHALAWQDGVLYVGGNFTSAGNVPVNNIASWDGSAWKGLTEGLIAPVGNFSNMDPVNALCFWNGDLVAAGTFELAGGAPASHVAKWDGHEWSPLGLGVSSRNSAGISVGAYPSALTTDLAGNLYIAGDFNQAGTNVAQMIARWDGIDWHQLGDGLPRGIDNYLTSVYCDGTNVYAGGIVGGTKGLLRWDGTSWSAVDSPTYFVILCAAGNGKSLYIGAELSSPMASQTFGIARFDGNSWSIMGGGLLGSRPQEFYVPTSVGGITSFHERIITAGQVSDDKIAAWDGQSWDLIDPAPHASNPSVRCNALLSDGENLYVAGDSFALPRVNGTFADGVARYDGTNWFRLAAGLPDPGLSLASRGNDLFVGHRSGISRWDGITWSQLGDDLHGPVYALALDRGDLFAGGNFTNSGATPLHNVARWDGLTWSPLGEGFNSRVKALAVMNHVLYAAGDFTQSGEIDLDHIASWNGSTWTRVDTSNLGPAGTVTACEALFPAPDGTLYLGGSFGLQTVSWLKEKTVHPLDASVFYGSENTPSATALFLRGADLFVGGDFLMPDALNLRFARWHFTRPLLSPTAVAPRAANEGSPFTCVLTISNPSDVPFSNCVLQASLPLGTSFAGPSGEPQLSGALASWSLGTLAPGQTTNLELTITAIPSSTPFVILDDYSVTDATGGVFRGSPLYISIIRPDKPPILSITRFESKPDGSNLLGLRVTLPASTVSDIELQTSPNLGAWTTITNTTPTNGIADFLDEHSTDPARYYRVISTLNP